MSLEQAISRLLDLVRHELLDQQELSGGQREALSRACFNLKRAAQLASNGHPNDGEQHQRMTSALILLAEAGLFDAKDVRNSPATSGIISSSTEKNYQASNGSSPGEWEAVRTSEELLAWARGEFSEEEYVAGIREIRETGGLELREFIAELERMVESDG